MQAVRLLSSGELVLADVPIPMPEPGDILVRIEACGICGSDRHMFKGEYPTLKPVTLGHEFCGIVESVGADIGAIAIGERVTGDPNIFCGSCPQCRRGRFNLCDNLSAIGVWRDGGFAEYVVMPQGQAHRLPLTLDPLHGAFCEPLACCLHGLDIARIRPGDSVAVLGGGVIGLLMVQLARLAGAGTVIVSTRQKPRRDLALQLGATHAVDPSAVDGTAAIRDIVPGGVDVVLECAGVAETFQQSLKLARRGGAVVVFGVVPAGLEVPVYPFDILVNELRIEAAYLNPLTHARAVAMIAGGVLEIDRLITRTIGLEEVPAVIAAKPELGEIKIIAVPG
jgi:L-iditol 2-dehydrogenase